MSSSRSDFWTIDPDDNVLRDLIFAAYPKLASENRDYPRSLDSQLTYIGELEDLLQMMQDGKWLAVIRPPIKLQSQGDHLIQILRSQVKNLPELLSVGAAKSEYSFIYSHNQLVIDIHYRDEPPLRIADSRLWFLYYRAACTDQLGTFLSKSFTISSLEQELLEARNKAEVALGGELHALQYLLDFAERN
jgi:hypothetical protein